MDMREADKLVDDIILAFQQKYGHRDGRSRALGLLQYYVSFSLRNNFDQEIVKQCLTEKLEELMLDIVSGNTTTDEGDMIL